MNVEIYFTSTKPSRLQKLFFFFFLMVKPLGYIISEKNQQITRANLNKNIPRLLHICANTTKEDQYH